MMTRIPDDYGEGSVSELECPCCGDVGAYSGAGGYYYDGQPLVCGCDGHVSVDSEEDPYILVFDS